MAKFLGSTGLTYLWSKIKTWVGSYVKITSATGKDTITAGSSSVDIYDWAQQSTKPSYNLDEVSAGTTNKPFTSTEKTKLSGIATGAEVNQNAYAKVKVGSTVIEADAKQDTVEFAAGSNGLVTITPDTTNDKVTIEVDKDLSNYDNSESGFITASDIPEGVQPYTSNPAMNGTASAGTSTKYAKGDHVHPSDTSKANASELKIEAVSGASDKKKITLKSGTSQEVLIAHQDISGKVDNTTTVNGHALSSNVTVTKSDVGLGNVDNKSSETIRSEITSANVTNALGFTPLDAAQKGAASGVCPLDANSKIDTQYLPSYVDDVVEAYIRSGQTALSSTWLAKGSASGTVITPEAGVIYVLMNSSSDYPENTQFRWGGTAYVKLNDGGISEMTTSEMDTATNNWS